uniref:Inner membrane-spanning protein YciB n=1 Tax=Candidatus Kentrum sp. SD TaxID=2126332 RepID=A0A450Y6S0_9GAMM|nr:MAG: intracellular septation protein [Candidatus Kentron sp. SD]VFK41512.1 MAG: intracellular septation protein [Candidatus Kentron sp. SD]VFK78501.1 MAG: intracellular septation protein [Candidatus Kentron sp. SD]
MKFLFDFFPILLFFLAFWFYDELKSELMDLGIDPALLTFHENSNTEGILVATIVAIAATFIQVAILWFRRHRVENMHLITLVLLVFFGGATLLFKEEIFIKWKPTAVNWLFALVFWGSQFAWGRKPLVRRMLESNMEIELSDAMWQRLNMSWVLFFVGMGFVNLYVVYHFSTEFWVNFKLFGLLGLTLVFVIGQSFYLMRYMKPNLDLRNQK